MGWSYFVDLCGCPSFNPLCVSVPTLHNIKNASFTEFWGDKMQSVGICGFKLGSVHGGQVWGL